MSKPLQILDPNYVALTTEWLVHLRTQERVRVADAVERGIAKYVDDTAEYFGDMTLKTLAEAAKQAPDGIQGMVLGIIREDTVSIYMVGLPLDLQSAVLTLAAAVDQLQPPPPTESLH